MDLNALFKIEYGLYVVSSSYDNKDNGCIINTVMQVTNTPPRLAITVNKANLTHDLILNSSEFNLSCLTVDTPFEVVKHFGFQSGKDVNKFADCEQECRTHNGVLYVPKYTNAYISCHVIKAIDLDTHTMFIADILETEILSDRPSLTYNYYFDHLKPKPEKKVKGWRCVICGYVYEGEELPADFICPICKHGVEDFEKVE